MADDFYKIKRIYEDYAVGSNQSNYPSGVSYDNKNSYRTTSSMSGPGNGPETGSGGGGPSTGDLLNFPADKMLSPEQAMKVVEEILEHEIDLASERDMRYAVAALKRVQKTLLQVQMQG